MMGDADITVSTVNIGVEKKTADLCLMLDKITPANSCCEMLSASYVVNMAMSRM